MFGAEVMRLLREKWKSPMALAQEIYAILQSDIPLTHSGPMTLKQREESSEAPLTIRTFGGGTPALRFVNRHGVEIGGFTLDNGTMVLTGQARKAQKCRCPDRGPFTPAIVWPGPADPSAILGGRVLDGDILNAFALDPRTISDPTPTVVPGVFVYTPAAGTVLTGNTSLTLHVDFTPTDTVTFTTASSDFGINVATISEHFLGVAPPVVVGELIIVKVTVQTNALDAEPAASTVTVSDSLGNAFFQAGAYQSTWAMFPTGPPPHTSMKLTTSIWYAPVTSPGTATISVTPSSGAATWGTTVVRNARPAAPLDAVATKADVIDDDPEIVQTGLIASSAADGELNLFVANGVYVLADFVLSGSVSFTTRINHDPQNMTFSLHGAVTTPLSNYVAIGASFRQKPA